VTPSHCSWYVDTGTEYSIQYEKYDKTTFVGCGNIGLNIQFDGPKYANPTNVVL